MSIRIGSREIGAQHKPFIIAELSANHGQSLEKALRMVDVAASTGADAIKIQTYTPDTLTLDISSGEFFIDDPKSLWHGYSLYKLYQEAMTPWQWHEEIFQRAASHGMEYFSTPFDNTAVDFLEKLNVPCYKIASFENIDHGLLKRVAQTKKPVIISTGMASLDELKESIEVLRSNGTTEIVMLKCTTSYPAEPLDANIRSMTQLKETFGCEIGLSDHTLGTGVATASIVLGATVIEKHFVLSRADGDIDGEFSLEPEEFKQLVIETKRAWQALGSTQYAPSEKELLSRRHRRSLYITEDLKAGEILTEKSVRSIRPGLGLAPKYLDQVIGCIVTKDVARGTALSWDLIKK